MPWDDELYIGTFAGGVDGMVKVSSLGEGVFASHIAKGAFTVDPVSYSQTVKLLDGTETFAGWLQCAWHIPGMRDEQHAALDAFRTDHTTKVYIRTIDYDGKTYKNFLANAIFPVQVIREDPHAVEAGAVFDWAIQFVKLIEQPEYYA